MRRVTQWFCDLNFSVFDLAKRNGICTSDSSTTQDPGTARPASTEGVITATQDPTDESLHGQGSGNGGTRKSTWKPILTEAEQLAQRHTEPRTDGTRLDSASALVKAEK